MALLDNTATMLDGILANVHAIDSTRVSTATKDAIRARALDTMRSILLEVAKLRDFTFRYSITAAAALASGGTDVSVSGSWTNEGRDGGIWRNQEPLGRVYWRPLHDILHRLQTLTETGPPQMYSVIGNRTVKVWPRADQAYTLYIVSLPEISSIADSTGGSNGLSTYPEALRNAVYLGTAMWESRRKGNLVDYGTFKENYEAAKFDLVCSEGQGAPDPRFMPRFAGAADVFSLE